MNILLIHPKLGKRDSPRFPLGLGYIAAVLCEAGHKVEAVDLNAQSELENGLSERIRNGKFDMVGLSAMITQFKEVKRLSSLIKNVTKTKIVLGGGLGSSVPELILQETDVDILVVGEGERTIVELVDRIEHQQSIADVDGIAYRDNGNYVKTPPRSYIEDLSSIPFPAWDLFPIEQYFQDVRANFPKRRMSVITGRGCPYRCSFCFHGIFGYKYRSRSSENLFKEIELLSKKYSIRGINFEDDTFILDRRRVDKICDLFARKNPKISWTCNGRANLIDKDLLKKMKLTGCVEIAYGIESGSQRVLNNIDKGIEVSKSREAIKLTWEAGIVPHGFMMLGIPGETYQTIQESINFCKEIGILAEFTIATPIPGTRLYQTAVEKGKIVSLKKLLEDWGNWFEEIPVNLTDIDSSELQRLKKQAEKEVYYSYIMKRKKHMVKMLLKEFKTKGVRAFVIRLFRGMRLIYRVSRGHGLSGVRKNTDSSSTTNNFAKILVNGYRKNP